MNIDAHSAIVILSVLVVLSYLFNYLAKQFRIPSVLLLISSGIGLKFAAGYFGFVVPSTKILLEILGITGLIFIVLEAALDLKIERSKFSLIGRSFVSALILLALTSGLIAWGFMIYFSIEFNQALLHAIPFSVISSAIAIPSVKNLEDDKREFIVYESTFSDILGIVLFNYVLFDQISGAGSILTFGKDIILIVIISVISTAFLVFLLSRTTSHVRFFLTFAILILAYSFAKSLHLPSLILVLCFGIVVNNFNLFDYPLMRRYLSFDRLTEVTKEMKLMTAETAFIIRTFFFLLFGFSLNLSLVADKEVILMGVGIIVVTLLVRFIFLQYVLKINSAPLALIAPRGLITILLFFTIPEDKRLVNLSEGLLFVVIGITGVMMMVGLLLNKQRPEEKIEDLI
ncbi:hypothetical protein BH10BAC4_BH10BAC4_15600 [soil metagenome]